jgi:hypothetical protein
VFTYLAEELRTDDVAARGSGAHANWSAQGLIPELCAKAGPIRWLAAERVIRLASELA